jgi:hypothetical protein
LEINVSDWLQAADHEVEMRRWRDQSHGKTKEVPVEIAFEGIAPEVIRWYYTNFDEASYRMWHPSHIGLQWENKIVGPGAIHIAWEMVHGKLAAYRIRVDSPTDVPASLGAPKDSMVLSILDTEGETLFNIVTRYLETEGGTLKKSRFVIPEAAPKEFCEAHRKHWLEEQPGMAFQAAPYLIKKTFGHMVGKEILTLDKIMVPAPTR